MIDKLVNGDYGLAKTFWLWCFLGNFFWKLLFGFAYGAGLPKVLILLLGVCFILYFFAAYKGLWSASTKYQGNQIWKYLARLVVVLGSLSIVISAFSLLVR